MADRDAVFVLGLGAQRSATTWLWWYLNTQPDSDLGPLRGFHVWDALGVPELGYRLSAFLGIEPDPERALDRVHSITPRRAAVGTDHRRRAGRVRRRVRRLRRAVPRDPGALDARARSGRGRLAWPR